MQATPANIAAAQAIVPGIGLPFANYQGTIGQMLKPFPQYSGVTYYSGNLGNSIYVGTGKGQVFVTRDGGGSGSSNNWFNISLGLDGSPVTSIITDAAKMKLGLT